MNMREYWMCDAKKCMQFLTKNDELFADYWTRRYLDNLKYLSKGKRILDIGCGNAKYFLKLEDNFEDLIGIELDKSHFESAGYIYPQGIYIAANASSLPFKDQSFDAIISFGAFEHNDNIDSIFKECYRVLKNDSSLLFSVPNYNSPYFPYCYFSHVLKRDDIIASIGHHYMKNDIVSRLNKCGFKRIKIVDSIYAAPIPLLVLINTFIKKIISFPLRNNEDNQGDNLENNDSSKKLKYFLRKIDYYYSKIFYPLERIGFGFMRLIYCEK